MFFFFYYNKQKLLELLFSKDILYVFTWLEMRVDAQL